MMLILVAVVAGLYLKQRSDAESHRIRSEYQRAKASVADNCSGKASCVVIYVTPWCPSCKQLKPLLLQALERSKTVLDTGLKLIVGQGKTPAANEEEAMSFGAGAVTDNDGAFHKALAVESYPSFFVLDQKQNITLRGQEAANQFSRTFLGPR